MTKVLLVEDDNNLREIYEARLQAEGYTIVSAHDGEEALVVAKAEKPDLIISDVMMPKISGFEMLDILRNTDNLKNVKVMMLTALGQSDDQQRADKLGADRYLVKSQVTLEDIVNVANELVKPSAAAASSPAVPPTPAATTSTPAAPAIDVAVPTPPAEPVSTPPAAEPAALSTPPTTTSQPAAPMADTAVTTPPAEPAVSPNEPTSSTETTVATPAPVATQLAEDKDMAESSSDEQGDVKNQIESFINKSDGSASPVITPIKVTPSTELPTEDPNQSQDDSVAAGQPSANPDSTTDSAAAAYSPQPTGKKVIEPMADSEAQKPDINALLERESAQEILDNTDAGTTTATPVVSSASQPVTAPVSNPGDGVDPNTIAL